MIAKVHYPGSPRPTEPPPRAAPIRLPTPAEVEARILDLERLVSASPTQAREALRRLFTGGAIRLEPQPDGVHIARSEILPLVMFGPTGAKPHPDIPVGPAYTSLGCAGLQRDFPALQVRGVAEVWVPFEGLIAVGW